MEQVQTSEGNKALQRWIRRFEWISSLVDFVLAFIGGLLLWKFTTLSNFILSSSLIFLGLVIFQDLFFIQFLRSRHVLLRWQAILMWILNGIMCAAVVVILVFLSLPKPLRLWETEWGWWEFLVGLAFWFLPRWFLVGKKVRTIMEES